MVRVGILTDSTAQFAEPFFPGYELVSVIPSSVHFRDRSYPATEGLRLADLPLSARDGAAPTLKPASSEEFQRILVHLSMRFDEIIVILSSVFLNPAVSKARQASSEVRGRLNVLVIDSQTTAIGLGLLVRAAAAAAMAGDNGVEIKRQVLGWIPHVYSMFYISGLTYLQRMGSLNPAQSLVGEMLDIMPLFIMENGRLVPVQKARSSRHLVDSLHEFVCEFGDIQHIAIIQGMPPFDSEVQALRDRILETYPANVLSEHTIGVPLATMIGPRCLGLFIMENP